MCLNRISGFAALRQADGSVFDLPGVFRIDRGESSPRLGLPLSNIDQALVFMTQPLGHDAVLKRNRGGAAAQFVHLESGGSLVAHVQALAVAIRSQEDVVFDCGVFLCALSWRPL